jgi:hypothetical protein
VQISDTQWQISHASHLALAALASHIQGTLIANPINRWTIGDRTTGLVYSANGELTLTLSYAQPTDPTQAANWLPTTNTTYFLVLRLYDPFPSVIDGQYAPPPVLPISSASGRKRAAHRRAL